MQTFHWAKRLIIMRVTTRLFLALSALVFYASISLAAFEYGEQTGWTSPTIALLLWFAVPASAAAASAIRTAIRLGRIVQRRVLRTRTLPLMQQGMRTH